ncbi:2-hydroxyacyl-CoA dehydratase family protein [Marinilabilia sp.]|uniref:2-hydroxyacyl-CoA dehydratase family protein n=1 Tax=Marinilabilia sp. TaxID=2021252 RepID=UPI0025BC0548|nr:2-hydroxyacyl-CoA dehydratase family protein [Marinilabilia sp.]
MKNFDKASIISNVAYKKNKARFLPRDEQMQLNNAMKQKIVRFASEIAAEENRPQTMKLFDEMMNGMHGQRVRDLYAYRREGNHVMALLCNSIPPELIYSLGNFIPVSVCMGAGEVEPYADQYTRGMCNVTRSMIGFLHTGMCVFFNLADYVLGSDLCLSVKKATDLVSRISDDFEVNCLKVRRDDAIGFDFEGFYEWVMKSTLGAGINVGKLIEYSRLFSDIREEYRAVLEFRKHSNPPINGKNGLWIQQLALVEEPAKLLAALRELKAELSRNVANNVGYNKEGRKKRVMLITPRIMPPFGEIYRIIENAGGLVVCEESDMGITNISYDFEEFQKLLAGKNPDIRKAVKYMMESVDENSSSCVPTFDLEKLEQKIKEYRVDVVINYSFKNCDIMESKTKNINESLNNSGIPSFRLTTDYMELYEKEQEYENLISSFLNP